MQQNKMTRDHLTVTLALTKLAGNKLAYFSATAEERHPKTGRVESCGAMHDAILAKFPELADFVALHLADENGEPMYAEANGYYWLAGALGGLGEKYSPLNGTPAKSVQECLAIFADHVRVTVEQADALIDSFKGGQAAVRPQFAAWVEAQRPRWKAEADVVIAKYLTSRLKLKIEPQQEGFVHASAVDSMKRVAREAGDLDVAVHMLRDCLDSHWWVVGRSGHHVWISWRTQYEPVRVAMIVEADEKPSRRVRSWSDALTIEAAKQGDIVRGDIVRSYDFPGSRDDTYVEGVVKLVEADRVLIHVTGEVWDGKAEQVSRFEVWGPLGVSSLSGAPCVFLIEKRTAKS